jgi:hypothetical protein
MISKLPTNVFGLKFLFFDGFNLLVGNNYFSPNTNVKVIENYFNSLEIKLNPQIFRVVLLGDFNVPDYDWINGFPQANSHYYTEIRGKGCGSQCHMLSCTFSAQPYHPKQ